MVKKKKKSGKKSYAKKKKVSAGKIKKFKNTEISTRGEKNSEIESKNSKSKSKQNTNKKLIPYKSFGQKLFEILSNSQPQKDQVINLPEGDTKIKNLTKIFKVSAVFAIVLLIVLCVELLMNGKTSPFITIANSYPIGFKNEQDLSRSIASYLEKTINEEFFITINDKTEKFSLKDLGYSYDLEATISNISRFDISKQNFFDMFNTVVYPKFNSSFEQTQKLIEEKFNLNYQKPKNASLTFQDKTLIVIPEQNGLELNWNEFTTELDNLAKNTKLIPLEFKLKTAYPTLTSLELEPKLESISSVLKQEIVINTNNKKFKVTPIDFIASLKFDHDSNGIKYSVQVENSQEYFTEKLYSKVEKPSSSIKITKDENGIITFEGNAQDGIEIEKQDLNKLLSKALNENQKEIQIPVSIKKAKVEVSENLKELGITSLIGVGHTAFAGSPTNRRTNIKVGMEKYNGLIIKPGEEFSFNKHLGEVDAESGFVRELVIKAEGTVPEYGGGVCQVSSTAYKAALFSGLPITERRAHSYAVGYYAQIDGHGLDSTIYSGVVDLKFLNDTPNHILIQSYVEGDQAFIKFFGTDDGRKVRLEGPFQSNYRPPGGTQLIPSSTLPTGAKKQVEKANAGFDILWNRYIQKPDEFGQLGEEIKENIVSKYRATANKILVGQ